jgi:hypothetical protein
LTGLDIFALIILVILVITAVTAWAILGMYPGRIARARNHPQADAISACGWWGAITMGLLTPVAFIWAFTNPKFTVTGNPVESGVPPVDESDGEAISDEGAAS